MKRCLTWMMLLGMLLLTACGAKGAYEVELDRVFTVDPEGRTVSWEDCTVAYATGGDQETDWVEITYPDGSTFRRFWTDGERDHSASADYDPERYLPGETVLEVLKREIPTGEMDAGLMSGAVGLFLAGMGGFYALFPGQALQLRTSGASRGEGKGSAALKLTRYLGLVCLGLGLALALWSFLLAG